MKADFLDAVYVHEAIAQQTGLTADTQSSAVEFSGRPQRIGVFGSALNAGGDADEQLTLTLQGRDDGGLWQDVEEPDGTTCEQVISQGDGQTFFRLETGNDEYVEYRVSAVVEGTTPDFDVGGVYIVGADPLVRPVTQV